MRGQLRSQLCFIANRFKSPVAQGTGDVREDVPWVLTRVPTFPPLLTQIAESNNHLCGMCIRLCVGRKKGEATSLRNKRPTVLRTPSPDAFCFQGADFSHPLLPARHPSHTCSPKQPHETSATAHCPDETEEGREGGEENGDPVYETCASQTTSQFLGDVFNI